MEQEEDFIINPVFSNRQLEESTLPTLATLEYSPLEKNLLRADLLWIVLFFSIAMIVIVALKYVFELPWFLAYGHWIIIGLMAIFLLSVLLTYFGFFRKSYAIREKDIIYNSGLFWRSSIAIPFNRVQHCEVSIGPIDRLFGLSELKVFTAGGSSSDLSINGLKPATSNRIKDFIVRKTGIDEEE